MLECSPRARPKRNGKQADDPIEVQVRGGGKVQGRHHQDESAHDVAEGRGGRAPALPTTLLPSSALGERCWKNKCPQAVSPDAARKWSMVDLVVGTAPGFATQSRADEIQ